MSDATVADLLKNADELTQGVEAEGDFGYKPDVMDVKYTKKEADALGKPELKGKPTGEKVAVLRIYNPNNTPAGRADVQAENAYKIASVYAKMVENENTGMLGVAAVMLTTARKFEKIHNEFAAGQKYEDGKAIPVKEIGGFKKPEAVVDKLPRVKLA